MLHVSAENGKGEHAHCAQLLERQSTGGEPGSDAIDRLIPARVLAEERVVVATERVVLSAELGIAARMHRREGADRLFVHRRFVLSRTLSDRS